MALSKAIKKYSHLAEIPADELVWLSSHLSDGEHITPAYFEPAELPLIVVQDKEAELKRRLEADESDKRISIAALSLARNFTAHIDGDIQSRLYINLNNTSIQALLRAAQNNHPQAVEAASILRAIKVLLTPTVAQGKQGDLNSALACLGNTVQQLIK